MNEEVKSKITNPERVLRIIHRMCEGKMQALIRLSNSSKLGIRCSFLSVDETASSPMIFFDGISKSGAEKLSPGDVVKFEVIGMPSKIVFATKILEKSAMGLTCSLPGSLVSIERRQNARYTTTLSRMAYYVPGFWKPSIDDIASPPCIYSYADLTNWLPILDISAGGLCIKTHFPSILTSIQDLTLDENAKLILPMSEPIDLSVTIRWQRRIKNKFSDGDKDRHQLDFRFGIEFAEISEQDQLKIKQFLRQLSLADAI